MKTTYLFSKSQRNMPRGHANTKPRRATAGLGRLALAASFTFATLVIGGCEKKADSGTGPTSGPSNGPSPAAAAGAKRQKTAYQTASFDAAWKSEIDNPKSAAAPMPKRVEAFVARVGKPDAEEGTTKVWYALDGDKCMKIELSPGGAIGQIKTNNSDCGI